MHTCGYDKNKISLVVADIDGCLTQGKKSSIDIDSLKLLRDYNNGLVKMGLPPLVFCTGRPQPYVEALSQLLGVKMPCVCENGAVIYKPDQDTILIHPTIRPSFLHEINRMREKFSDGHLSGITFQVEPGKEVCISLNPISKDGGEEFSLREKVVELYNVVKDMVDQSIFSVNHSTTAVDITPFGIDKGVGVRWLSQLTSIDEQFMLGIGDSAGDIPFLTRVGYPAAPENACDAVKSVAKYVSPLPFAEGVVDIINVLVKQSGHDTFGVHP